MSRDPIKASITGMRKGYGEYALSQHDAVVKGVDRANQLIESIEFNPADGSYIHMVDLGAADGINSFPVVENFSRALMKKGSPLKLLVSHVDLPSADFNGLSHNIQACEYSYRQSLANEDVILHSALVPGSFYDAFLPAGSADIVFSTTALHYAAKPASSLSQHVLPLFANGINEKPAWDHQSDSDLNTALLNIHSSLKSGGKFWAVVPAYSCDEATGEIANYWYREVLDIMCDQLLALVDKGIMDITSWDDFVLPVHQRHLQQWQRWFTDNASMFRLDFLYEEEQSNPYLRRYRNEHHNPERFADEYLSSIRAWSEQIIMRLLPDHEQRNVFFEGLRDQFLREPDRFENDAFSVYIGATRL